LLYVDHIVLAASSTRLLDRITASLRSEFVMTDMGSLHYFLGIAVTRDSSGMHFSQAKYAAEILDNANMTACKSATTPVDTSPMLSASAGPPVADPTKYRSLAGLSSTSPLRALTLYFICSKIVKVYVLS
jgi:hypothetical protein